MKAAFCSAIVLALVAVQGAQAKQAISHFTKGTGGYVTGTAGWSFQTLDPISVTSLGCFDYVLSNQNPVTIGLWDSGGNLLASSTITLGSHEDNDARYETIPALSLAANSTYWIGAHSSDGFLLVNAAGPDDIGGSISLSSGLGLSKAAFGGSGFTFPTLDAGPDGSAYLAPNFQFEPVPEPSTVVLGAAGMLFLLFWRRRKAVAHARQNYS